MEHSHFVEHCRRCDAIIAQCRCAAAAKQRLKRLLCEKCLVLPEPTTMHEPRPIARDDEFKRELAALINRYSLENASDTPDYVLADYLFSALRAFNSGIVARDIHAGRR